MSLFKVPVPKNEPILSYAKGTKERELLTECIKNMRSCEEHIYMNIGGEKIKGKNKIRMFCPHDHKHTLGYFYEGDASDVHKAIVSSLQAREKWSRLEWEQRASIFLKAADLAATTYRYKLNASTMLAQSKNVFQAEIDAACEFIDFLRFNVAFMREIYENQPESSPGIWNRMDYRALEGFVFAVTPFNFSSIAGNLAVSPALMGNTVIWKPAYQQVYSAKIIMDILTEAGLPDGVINLLFVDGPIAGDIIFQNPHFAGVHFTGSTSVFQQIWKSIGNNIHTYKSYPRIVGETGGKDFIVAHKSADIKALATGIIRGAFEYQGQKCSAASRAYIPDNLWEELKNILIKEVQSFTIGGPENFHNFINAVIDARAFQKITGYIEKAKKSPDVTIITGGNYDDTNGYFIEPTILITTDYNYLTMCEEIFGPVLTLYVYKAQEFDNILEVVNNTSPYGLTGAIFSQDRYAIAMATEKLKDAAGNLYINDKPTGAVVGQQPFGGGRYSGTNDKAGSLFNLLRWVQPRTIKENFIPPYDYKYPFQL